MSNNVGKRELHSCCPDDILVYGDLYKRYSLACYVSSGSCTSATWWSGESFHLEAKWLSDNSLHQQFTCACVTQCSKIIVGVHSQRLMGRLIARTGLFSLRPRRGLQNAPYAERRVRRTTIHRRTSTPASFIFVVGGFRRSEVTERRLDDVRALLVDATNT